MNKVSHDSETPASGQQVITACAFIYDDSEGQVKVFLPKRALTKKFLPGVYELPGGHIDFAEDIEDGLRREIKEELGMNVRLGDCFACFTYLNKVKGSHSIEVVYFARFIDLLEKITINPEDHETFGWFTRAELDANKQVMRANLDAGSLNNKPGDQDREFETVMKGFKLLEGEKPDFAS